MGPNWENLAGDAATETILRGAISCGAAEIHFSADYEGASVFFVSAEQIEFFAHLPVVCRARIYDRLRDLAGVDSWRRPPVRGYGVFAWDGGSFELEIAFNKGCVDVDVAIKISGKG